jgi:carboxylate-amine ligase
VSDHADLRTVGVEEELLLVDRETGSPRAIASRVLHRAGEEAPSDGDIEAELQQQQIEVETSPCTGMDDLLRQVRDWRQYADDLARQSGARLAALATSPLSVDPQAMVKPRYQRMVRRFGLMATEQLTCGCHVHVGVTDDEEGVAAIDRIQPWLPALTALSANSPFWHGQDSGYASYRTQVWSRLPTAGPTGVFGDRRSYHDYVDRLVRTGVPLDPDMIYFNARLSRHYPTVEIRVADICLRAEDAVVIAALIRALVDTAATEAASGERTRPTDPALLRLAQWQASRDGLGGNLLDPDESVPRPAADVIAQLLDHVTAALEANGDLERVRTGVERVFQDGNGAEVQRRLLREGQDLPGVVRSIAELTVG